MTIGQTLVDQSRVTLIDSAKVTWSDATLLGFLNAGIAQACGTLLDLFVLAQMTPLAAGVRQVLPAGGVMLFDVPRNDAGQVVLRGRADEYSKTQAAWPSAEETASVRYWFYDERAPRTFLVAPPATNGAEVELVYAAVPPPIELNGTVPISPAFDMALWAYINAMALAKSTRRQDLGKTQQYMTIFTSVLETWKRGGASTIKKPDAQGVF